jgi:hypothetical protein
MTGSLSLLGIVTKAATDYHLDVTARGSQKKEREAREAFENEQRRANQDFQRSQIEAASLSEARTKVALEEFISQKKWRDERRDHRLALLHSAAIQLRTTIDDIANLVGFSPAYDDFQMISETAKVLDSLSTLKLSLSHLSLPGHFSEAGRSLLDKITRLLLTLSPDRSVRQQSERKARLAVLVDELREEGSAFETHCRRYENSPSDFE